MFVKVNRPSSSVEGHPYIHWYTQRAFVNLLAETKSRRKCVECQKDLQRAPEIVRRHCWDHFVYYLCTCGFLTARQESLHSHQRRAECSGYEKIDAYNRDRAAEDLNIQLPRAWDKLTARPVPESERHGVQSLNKAKPKASILTARAEKRSAPVTSDSRTKTRPLALNQLQVVKSTPSATVAVAATPTAAATPTETGRPTPRRRQAAATAPPPPPSSSSSSSEDEQTLLTRSPVRRRIKEQYVAELNFNMARIEDLERLKAPLTARNAELLKLICE